MNSAEILQFIPAAVNGDRDLAWVVDGIHDLLRVEPTIPLRRTIGSVEDGVRIFAQRIQAFDRRRAGVLAPEVVNWAKDIAGKCIDRIIAIRLEERAQREAKCNTLRRKRRTQYTLRGWIKFTRDNYPSQYSEYSKLRKKRDTGGLSTEEAAQLRQLIVQYRRVFTSWIKTNQSELYQRQRRKVNNRVRQRRAKRKIQDPAGYQAHLERDRRWRIIHPEKYAEQLRQRRARYAAFKRDYPEEHQKLLAARRRAYAISRQTELSPQQPDSNGESPIT